MGRPTLLTNPVPTSDAHGPRARLQAEGYRWLELEIVQTELEDEKEGLSHSGPPILRLTPKFSVPTALQ